MNYPKIKLGELCEFRYGESLPEAKRANGSFPVYGSNGIVGWHDSSLTSGETIIVGRKGSAGEVNYSPKPCWPIDTTYYIDKTNMPCDFTWLYYTLTSANLSELEKSAAVPGLNRNDAYEVQIVYPPISEQKQIAATLQKVDRIRRLRRYVRRLSDRYLQSVFLEMFGDPLTNLKGWQSYELGKFIEFQTSGSRGWAEYYRDKGDIFLRIQNVGRDRLLLDDLTYVQPPKSTEAKRTQVKTGDVLISITADLGRTAVIPEKFPTAYINQHLTLLRLRDIRPGFVSAYISSPGGQDQIQALDKPGVKSGLNFNDIKGYKIFYPPIELQEKYISISNHYQSVQRKVNESERQAEHLFQSLLVNCIT